MRQLILIAGLICFAGAASASEYATIFTCTSNRAGAPTYKVEATEAEPRAHFVSIYHPDSLQPVRLAVSPGEVWGYGATYIITESYGRSGYVHLYANLGNGTSLIDINMFGADVHTNTNGPETSYKCAGNGGL